MRTDCDVVIVGGGLVGPVLALALASGGVRSIVVDAQPRDERLDPDFDGRAYALSVASRRMFDALGLWRDLGGKAQAINEITVSDGRAGEGAAAWFMHFDHREIEDGPMGHFLEDRFLRTALTKAVDASDFTEQRGGTRVIDHEVHAGHVAVRVEGGADLACALVVGCDGRNSAIARRAGIDRSVIDYHQTALVCAVAHERPHRGVAHQLFMPPGPLAILPLPGDRSSIVWTETRARAADIGGLDDAGYLAELRPRFGDFLGEIRLEGARYSYPLALSIAESFAGDRVALAGDAAHGIHPLAGQGLNLGLRDVAALAEVLTAARQRGEDLGAAAVLDRYQRWRRFDTAALALSTDAINRLFSNDIAPLRLARDLGLGIVNAVPPLRRSLIREAAGLSGDLPQLLRGRPL